MQHINNVGAAYRLRIVDAGLFEAKVVAQLLGAGLGDELHIFFGAELQTARRTSLDARGFQALADPVGTQRALVNLLCCRIKFRNVEGTTGNAVLAANAIFLVEVHNPVGILHDCAVGRAGAQAAGIGAVHALVLAHQPLNRAIFALVLVELDQVPEIPAGLRHGLVRVVEGGSAEGHVVPLDTRHFAGLAADTRSRVYQLANFQIALHACARNRPRMGRDHFGLKRFAVAHTRPILSRLSRFSRGNL